MNRNQMFMRPIFLLLPALLVSGAWFRSYFILDTYSYIAPIHRSKDVRSQRVTEFTSSGGGIELTFFVATIDDTKSASWFSSYKGGHMPVSFFSPPQKFGLHYRQDRPSDNPQQLQVPWATPTPPFSTIMYRDAISALHRLGFAASQQDFAYTPFETTHIHSLSIPYWLFLLLAIFPSAKRLLAKKRKVADPRFRFEVHTIADRDNQRR